MEVLSLELVQAGQLIVKLVDLSNTTATVGVKECLALSLVNAQLFPQGLNGFLQVMQTLLPVLLLTIELLQPGTEPPNVLLVETELLGGVAIVLYNSAVGLGLRGAEFCPELDDVL